MALRRAAAMLMRSAVTSSKAATRSELHTASAALPCIRQPQQLTSLARLAAAPSLQEAGRRGSIFVPRSFASEAHEVQPLGLKEAIKSEIEYEYDHYKRESALPAQPPSPWTLTESPGDSQLKLTREYNGETIEVTLLADECHDDEGDDEHPLAGMDPVTEDQEQNEELAQALEDSVQVGMVASANVSKSGKSLDISFRTDGTYMEVVDVSLGKPDVTDDNATAYAGPKYEELDEAVQGGFDDFLEQRGIDADFGEYLMMLVVDKEQREYVNWLQKVHDFL